MCVVRFCHTSLHIVKKADRALYVTFCEFDYTNGYSSNHLGDAKYCMLALEDLVPLLRKMKIQNWTGSPPNKKHSMAEKVWAEDEENHRHKNQTRQYFNYYGFRQLNNKSPRTPQIPPYIVSFSQIRKLSRESTVGLLYSIHVRSVKPEKLQSKNIERSRRAQPIRRNQHWVLPVSL